MKTDTLELSSTTVEQILEGNNLPSNFDKLSAKKQKEIIVKTVLETYQQITDTLEYKHKAEAAKKKLQLELKQNPTNLKLKSIGKQLKEISFKEVALIERYEGMKQLAAALGFDKKLLSQVQSTEPGE